MALRRRKGSDLAARQQRTAVDRSSTPSLAKRVADGAFWGYLGVAVAALSFQVAQDYRFGRSFARTRLCIARLDSTCVSRELEVESSIRRADPRTELAAASLSLLLHRPSAFAQATADSLEAAQRASMPVELRADLLLLRGDIALANGELKRAREVIDTARALLGDSELTTLRLRRVDDVESELASHMASSVAALRQSFERLFEATATGNRAVVDVRQAACSEWIGRVADAGARRQLFLALQSAARANLPRYAEPSLATHRALNEPPPLPSNEPRYDPVYGAGSFEERMQRYRERLARYEKEQAVIRERENLRASEAAATKQAALDQAREALAAGVAALTNASAPFIAPLQSAQSATRAESVGK